MSKEILDGVEILSVSEVLKTIFGERRVTLPEEAQELAKWCERHNATVYSSCNDMNSAVAHATAQGKHIVVMEHVNYE